LRFGCGFADFGNPWVGHETHDVAVPNERGYFSQILCFGPCGLSFVFYGPSGSLVEPEHSFVRFVLPKSLMQQPRTFSASSFCASFIIVKIRHSWPTCVLDVVWGIRLTAFNRGPRTGRVGQSTSKFVVLGLFLVEKHGPDFEPIVVHNFVAKKWALSKFEAEARCVAQILGPFFGHEIVARKWAQNLDRVFQPKTNPEPRTWTWTGPHVQCEALR